MKDDFNTGKALFNLQRFQILQTKLNPQTSHLIPDAYAFAWSEKLFPFFDESDLHSQYEEHFSITKKQVDVITKYSDDEWMSKKYHHFNHYLDYFRGHGISPSIDKHVLISTFRYMYLRGGFDPKFWESLLAQSPFEANVIVSDFNPDYIYIV